MKVVCGAFKKNIKLSNKNKLLEFCNELENHKEGEVLTVYYNPKNQE